MAIIRGLPVPNERIWKQDHSGFAIQGFDPVAYFLDGEPRPGRPAYEAVWSGVAWRFASAANRAAFLASPETYAPQFGGYDATIMARGVAADADPSLFVVRDGRLYLFRSRESLSAFAVPGTAEAARQGWSGARTAMAQR